ncbi:MAG TPA: phosphoenolpyruvate synthase, partial [Candidatus Babeliaceae bacterium]|nr:phosphoenolpyruvate synthase [Candidatus Babeliaceae bacterium]
RDGKLYILQARPETIHANKANTSITVEYKLNAPSACLPIITGQAIGQAIVHGTVRIITNPNHNLSLKPDDIIVTKMTDPDWLPLLKQANGIITDQGGRTCHAAIVARELGIPAVVGTMQGTRYLTNGQAITIDCSSGSQAKIYAGHLAYSKVIQDLTYNGCDQAQIMLNLADPARAASLSKLPVSGVGLARLEFIIADRLKIHPLAISRPTISNQKIQDYIQRQAKPYGSNKDFFIETLAQAIATLAAPFYPRPVIVRLTDFKSNEYRNLLGGELFEPHEENPMIGFRGASRYINSSYQEAFELECKALKKARETFGLSNIKIMVPFVRTLKEAELTVQVLKTNGLIRGVNSLELYMMVEIPSNILLLEEFAQYFDGFSIGSNDLTQLTLGIDRDSVIISESFDERDPAVKKFIATAIATAKRLGKPIGICGQAPSDFPDFAQWLIGQGISSISLNPDSVLSFLQNKLSEKRKPVLSI